MGDKIDLNELRKKLKKYTPGKGRRRRRFDYEKIKEHLINLGKQGKGVTRAVLEDIMKKFDATPEKTIYSPQIQRLLKRLVDDPSVDVYEDDTFYPTLYIFLPAEKKTE